MTDPFYRSKEWRALRAAVLRRDPICRTPGCTRPSTHVDHNTPRARGGSDHPSNLVGRCASCHSAKTAAADGGFGNKRRDRAPVKGCDADGLPLDPGHWWRQ